MIVIKARRAHFEFTLYYNHLPKYCFTFTIDISCKKIESNRIESNRVDVIFGESPITSEVYCYSLHESDVGFVVIVDRRQDRWTSVKTLLLRISVCELLFHVIQQLS